MTEDFQSYGELLSSLDDRLPDLHRILKVAQEGRTQRLSQYVKGVRLEGADELLRHLHLIERSLLDHGHENDMGFLVGRVTADFEIAIEAALTGIICVSYDAMRDVMEVEFLLCNFTAEPDQLDRWLHADQDTLKTEFSQNRLRQLKANRLGIDIRDLPEHTDYKGHSIALHVTPFRSPLTQKGFAEDSKLLFGADIAFWEIFHHARSFIFALYDLLAHERFSGVLNPDPRTGLPKISRAYEQTQDMQAMFFGIIASIPEVPNSDENT